MRLHTLLVGPLALLPVSAQSLQECPTVLISRQMAPSVEVSESDGAVYTANSHFPSWQSKGGVPTLLRIQALP